MVVDHKADGWSAYCLKCHGKGWLGKELSLAERLERLSRQKMEDERLSSDVSLPAPANHDIASWPLEARVWLYKAGISNDAIHRYGIYHHAGSARVSTPCTGGY